MSILFRHILVELLKVLAVTTSVLVTVIAFGAAVKPLAENLLGPTDLLKFMAYATVPMLQFALPFSAAFAGVVVYHRLTSDNEILAMAVSGIPYRRILRPALALGVALTIVMVFLLDIAIPAFWRSLKEITGEDVTRGFVALVQRGEAIDFDRHEIYADEAYVEDAPEDTGASQRLRLVGVTAVELEGPKGNRVPSREFTAQYATADVYRLGRNSHVKIVLQDATVFTRGDLSIAGAKVVRPETVDLGQTLEDESPKGFRTSELLAMRARPETASPIIERRAWVFAALDAIDAWTALGERVASGAPLLLTGTEVGGEGATTYEITGARIEGSSLEPARAGAQMAIRSRDASGQVRRDFRATRATLAPAPGSRFTLIADDAVPADTAGATAPRALRLTDLSLPDLPRADRALPNAALIELTERRAAALQFGPVAALRKQATDAVFALADREASLGRDIVARITQRAAQAVTALLMVVSASILAIHFRDRTPLFVYSLAFLPSIADILLISSGEQMLRANVSALGFATVAVGNLILVGICAWGAWRVGRH